MFLKKFLKSIFEVEFCLNCSQSRRPLGWPFLTFWILHIPIDILKSGIFYEDLAVLIILTEN